MRGTARLLALVLVFCLAPALAAVEPHTRQQPNFRTGVDLVAVDVRVVDGSGRPVAGLRPDEFVVKVDGNPRTIATADFLEYPVAAGVSRMSSSSPAPAAAPTFGSTDAGLAPSRTVILFMDEENIRAGYGKWAADAAARFVDRLQRDDLAGLVIPKSPTRIAPTTDHAAVKAALSHVVGHMAPVAFAEGIGLAAAFDSHYKNTDKAPNAAVEQIVADAHERTLGTLRSLVTLLDSLATEPGPKTVVLISEELPVSDHVQDVSRFNGEFTRLGEAAAKAQAALYVLQLDRPVGDVTDGRTASGEQESSPTRDRDVRSFGLETTSSITGGKRFLVSGTPDAALERVALEMSGQYLLGMRTEAADRDGKPHSITVTVKRTGVEVRARQMFAYAGASGRTGRAQAGPDPAVPPAAVTATSASPAPPPSAPRSPAEPASAANALAAVSNRSPTFGMAELMLRVASYIDDYAEKMLVVIGVEHYAQWLQREEASKTSVRGAGWQVVSRQTVAEFALVRNARDWDGYRNVYEVDGKPVPEAKDRFQRLFAETPASALEQSRKIAAESARYNMGPLQRNFNVPTIALFFLTKANQGRFTFTKDGDDQVAGVPVWKVTFEETQKPTLIKTSAGKDMPVRGEAWIDTVNGRVLKTHMQIDSEVVLQADMNAAKGAMAPWQDRERSATRRVKTTASITVTYATDARLGLLMPSEMLETYEAPMRNPVSGEDELAKINCRATYSDFKRFETSGRVITPTPAPPLAAAPPPTRPLTTNVTPPGAVSPPLARGEDDTRAPARSVEDVVARAGQELLRYAEQLSLVIGIEHYAQYKGDESFQRAAKQMLVAEFALVRMKDDWLGFRDVYEVDGKPVADRQDRLRALFLENAGAAMSQAQQITRESARYNLGAMQRNFNVPTTALFFLHPSNATRFRYRKDGEDSIDGTVVWKVKYEETQKPTIIRTSAGKDMPVKGTFWIDPVAGRVWKTHMELNAEARLDTGPRASEGFARAGSRGEYAAELTTQRIQSSASITVTYKRNSPLNLLLPDEMLETYEGPSINAFTGKSEFSRVNCRATYSDFKQFQTSGRVITPK